TGTFAIANMIFETNLEFALRYVFRTEQQRACSDGVQLPDKVKHVLHGRNTTVRTKIFALLRNVFARVDDPWKTLLQDTDIGKRLIVFEQDIVLRLILLDEVIFK